jgi:hypothetical protein
LSRIVSRVKGTRGAAEILRLQMTDNTNEDGLEFGDNSDDVTGLSGIFFNEREKQSIMKPYQSENRFN